MDIVITRQYGNGYTHTSHNHTHDASKYWAYKNVDERRRDAERRRVQQRYSRAFALFNSFDNWQHFVTITSDNATIRSNPKAMLQYASNLLRQTGVTFAVSLHRNPQGTGWHVHGLTDIPVYFDLLDNCSGKTYCEPVTDVQAAIRYILRDNHLIPMGMHTVAHSIDIRAIKPQSRVVADGIVLRDDFADANTSDCIDEACLDYYGYIMDSFDFDDDFDAAIDDIPDTSDASDASSASAAPDAEGSANQPPVRVVGKRSYSLVYTCCRKFIFAKKMMCVNYYNPGKWRPPRYHPPDTSKSCQIWQNYVDLC